MQEMSSMSVPQHSAPTAAMMMYGNAMRGVAVPVPYPLTSTMPPAAAPLAWSQQQSAPVTTAATPHHLSAATNTVISAIKDPILAQTKFPPNFDLYGAAYVFQSSTGLFLDQLSEFYYCPKSKLYYNSKNGIYYKYDINQTSETGVPFIRYNPPLPSTLSTETAIVNDTSSSSTNASSTNVVVASLVRQPVIISIGFGNKNKSNTAAASAATSQSAAAANVNKKVLTNFLKWESAREDFIEKDETATATSATIEAEESAFGKPNKLRSNSTTIMTNTNTNVTSITAGTTTSIPVDVPPVVSNTIVTQTATLSNATTAAEVPSTSGGAGVGVICVLCQRKFASAEQLVRHEKESKLHADNLAKLAATAVTPGQSQPAASTAAESMYRDRASERRAIQGTTTTTTALLLSGSSESSFNESSSSSRQRAYSHLDDTNTSTFAAPVFASISASAAPVISNTLKEDTANPGQSVSD